MIAIDNDTLLPRFHNLSDTVLADHIGQLDVILKGNEADLKALKDEFKRRGLTDVTGKNFVVTATDQLAARLDTKAIREFLGPSSYVRFDKAVVSTVVRIKPRIHYDDATARSQG